MLLGCLKENIVFQASPWRMRLSIAAIAITLMSCSSQHATYAPDGRRGYVVTCAGFLNSWSSCLTKAGRACGAKGYDTIQGTEDDRSMLIACRQ